MGRVTILPDTTRNPLTLMGERAGICWGSDISSPAKNKNRGMQCIEDGHGRVMEFVNVEMVLEGYSSRVIREYYTHIGGAPTRLQESTRYLDYKDGFKYVTPYRIDHNAFDECKEAYDKCMAEIAKTYRYLIEECKVPREDAAMVLPLGMQTRIVDKRNLRNLLDMAHTRLCSRAYWEFQDLMLDIRNELMQYSDEWMDICELFVPKCEFYGKCPEHNGCGHYEMWEELSK